MKNPSAFLVTSNFAIFSSILVEENLLKNFFLVTQASEELALLIDILRIHHEVYIAQFPYKIHGSFNSL